jgi:hypothetical protein
MISRAQKRRNDRKAARYVVKFVQRSPAQKLVEDFSLTLQRWIGVLEVLVPAKQVKAHKKPYVKKPTGKRVRDLKKYLKEYEKAQVVVRSVVARHLVTSYEDGTITVSMIGTANVDHVLATFHIDGYAPAHPDAIGFHDPGYTIEEA